VITPTKHLGNARFARPTALGFTLIEVMIATTLSFLVVILGIMSANYIGMREDLLIQSEAGASDTSRQAVNQFLSDIRTAKGYLIGSFTNGTPTSFSPVANGQLQSNTCLQLFPIVIATNQTIDTTKYIIYYFDLSDIANNDGHLVCFNNTNNGATTTTVIASNLINTLYFTSEDYSNNIQVDRTYKGVIHATLQYSEFQFPLTKVGTNYLYDYYRIDCRASPHLPDGP
jgi:Tfp pilus assembly protein PilW